jgi:hypothetical protein
MRFVHLDAGISQLRRTIIGQNLQGTHGQLHGSYVEDELWGQKRMRFVHLDAGISQLRRTIIG